MSENPSYLQGLQEQLGGAIEEIAHPHGQLCLVVKREAICQVLQFLMEDDEACFDLFLDLTAVDYLGREPRFEVVIHLSSIPKNHRIRIKVRLAEDDPFMPTITSVYPAANWFERECYDLYGIRFDGHPNLTRIMLYEGFEGHPLRKDYPVKGRQPRMPLRKPEVRRSDVAFEPPQG
ncbi:MAG: NADH-quinone oxidoreductase subunit C [bacterium]|nr:NADH-quinone oxidoreductase subunit C [bacterium]